MLHRFWKFCFVSVSLSFFSLNKTRIYWGKKEASLFQETAKLQEGE